MENFPIIICDENQEPVEADKHLLLVEKTSGKTFRVANSSNIRKIYKQHSSLKNVKDQMQPLTLSIKELQQHSSTTTNQAEHFTLLNKQLQQSSSITTSQPPPLILNQLKQLPSTVISHVQSPVLTDKQYFPPFISNPTESNVLNMNTQQSYETVLPHNDNNDAGQVTLPKIKRRKTNADTPRASWKHPAILCLIHHYKANMHVMNSNSKRHEEIWQDISDALAKQGYYFSHLQCEDKWKYLKKLYTETVDKNKESGTAENTCPYFKEFGEIYGKSHCINPPALASNRTLTNTPEIFSDSDQECIPKKKSRNSKQLESWTNIFRDDAAAREEARQKRHEELLALQKEQMQTQNTLLTKILEKLS